MLLGLGKRTTIRRNKCALVFFVFATGLVGWLKKLIYPWRTELMMGEQRGGRRRVGFMSTGWDDWGVTGPRTLSR